MVKKDQHLSDAALIVRLVVSAPDQSDSLHKHATAHLATCSSCSQRLDELRRFAALLREPEVWDRREITSTVRMDWLQRLTRLIEQVEEERASAEIVLPNILGKNRRETWRAKLLAAGEVNTVGMVDVLIARAEAMFASDPPSALEISVIAVDIAEALRVDAYPFDLVVNARASAAREHAFMLFYVGRLPEAVQAVDRAEQLFRQLPARDYDLARTAVIRALIYRSTDRAAEATVLCRQAASTFGFYGDRMREVRTRMTEAALVAQQGAFADAVAISHSLESDPQLQQDRAYGNLLQSLGTCYRELGDLDRARDYLARALVEHERHHAVAEMVRTRWSLGKTLVSATMYRDALSVLRQTWKEFDQLDVQLDGALVGLEVAEVHLLLGEPDEVPSICRTLLESWHGVTSCDGVGLFT
jgi:tetratricopeptide (TPR) repeat protein